MLLTKRRKANAASALLLVMASSSLNAGQLTVEHIN